MPRIPICRPRAACETRRKLAALLFAVSIVGAGGPAIAQPHAEPRASGQTEPGASHYAAGPVQEEHSGRGLIDVVARVVNFGILAGTLYYLLRSPFRTYLADRSTAIRSDLVNAAEMRRQAAAQIEEIDRRMAALPGELEALRAQGAREIADEEARIRQAADAERERLLAQARRDIDLRVKIAERELVAHAADLAVGVAAGRIKTQITDDDQRRLVDRYVQQLKSE